MMQSMTYIRIIAAVSNGCPRLAGETRGRFRLGGVIQDGNLGKWAKDKFLLMLMVSYQWLITPPPPMLVCLPSCKATLSRPQGKSDLSVPEFPKRKTSSHLNSDQRQWMRKAFWRSADKATFCFGFIQKLLTMPPWRGGSNNPYSCNVTWSRTRWTPFKLSAWLVCSGVCVELRSGGWDPEFQPMLRTWIECFGVSCSHHALIYIYWSHPWNTMYVFLNYVNLSYELGKV